ncbi:hypothetical protein [Paenibacillus ginsengihumi]|uniref:hypothetical protein n=1 Tax=Paenibacillus ginsengihumi TaxID=431596 RepID=UPI00037CF3E7|nr:hypothetical protein [Paenibacillus ginsengihumi]
MKPGDKVRKTLTVLRTSKHGVPTVYAIDELRYVILPEDVGKAVGKLKKKLQSDKTI